MIYPTLFEHYFRTGVCMYEHGTACTDDNNKTFKWAYLLQPSRLQLQTCTQCPAPVAEIRQQQMLWQCSWIAILVNSVLPVSTTVERQIAVRVSVRKKEMLNRECESLCDDEDDPSLENESDGPPELASSCGEEEEEGD
jgi:hypothetical protein